MAGTATLGSQECKYFSNCLNLSLVKILGIPGICIYKYHVKSSDVTNTQIVEL